MEDGWQPMIGPLKRRLPLPYPRKHSSQFARIDFAPHALASASFSYRAFRDECVTKILNGSKSNKMMIDYLRKFQEFRSRLGSAYVDADRKGELNLRESWRAGLPNMNFGEVAFITTNWTPLKYEGSELRPTIYLHGLAEHPNSMILPTELSQEDAVIDAALRLAEKCRLEDRELLSRGYRMTKSLAAVHRIAIEWLESARNLVFWGIELNVYDCELNTLLSLGNRSESSYLKVFIKNLKERESDLKLRVTNLTMTYKKERLKYIKRG